MKRHPQLQDLSREHHSALKLARAARRAAESGADEMVRLARHVADLFARELDPHFRVEEQGILVELADAGQDPVVQRTLHEHAELRRLASRIARPDAQTLLRFGDLLATHVRFEERELFEAAQRVMDLPE